MNYLYSRASRTEIKSSIIADRLIKKKKHKNLQKKKVKFVDLI